MKETIVPVDSQLSVYVHLPWCVQKCPYCDFNSHTLKQSLPEQAYVAALLADLTQDLMQFGANRQLHSIFFGGGTPSLFSGKAIATVINKIYEHLRIQAPAEITLEANPGTVDAVHFQDYLHAGVNRLSLGVQSFDTQALIQLGRIHDAESAIAAFRLARQLGFDNINIDLMFGLPNQSLQDGLRDLKTAIALGPEHISWYQLTLEPNTPFYRQPPTLPSHDAIYELYQQGRDLLASHGYAAYEVSAYAKPGRQCQHNLNYWRYGDYVGVGAGAHGKLTLTDPWHVVRTRKHAHPNQYLREPAVTAEQQAVNPQDILFEYLLNHLRLNESVDFDHVEAYTHQHRDTLITQANTAIINGFFTITSNTLTLTEKGRLFLDDVLASFLPEPL